MFIYYQVLGIKEEGLVSVLRSLPVQSETNRCLPHRMVNAPTVQRTGCQNLILNICEWVGGCKDRAEEVTWEEKILKEIQPNYQVLRRICWNSHALQACGGRWGIENDTTTLENSLVVSNSELTFPIRPSHSTPRYLPYRNENICSSKDFKAALLIIARHCKQPKCSSIGD